MTADELLKAVLESQLDRYAMYYEHKCQFCGFGPGEPFVDPLNAEAGPHLPSCLWLAIETYLKEAGKL